MNYDEARQLGPDSDAPGKWNWTTMNDRVVRTAVPCAYPDFDWDSVTTLDALAGNVKPTGRPRCDHDTREDAERHHWQHELSKVRVEPFDEERAHERFRCTVVREGEGELHERRCRNWEAARAWWPGGYRLEHLCEEHAAKPLAELFPFVPGMRSIHS